MSDYGNLNRDPLLAAGSAELTSIRPLTRREVVAGGIAATFGVAAAIYGKNSGTFSGGSSEQPAVVPSFGEQFHPAEQRISHEEISGVLRIAEKHLAKTSGRFAADIYPYYTSDNGVWSTRSGSGSWTAGFFPGSLWLMYQMTGNPTWKHQAEKRTLPIKADPKEEVSFRISTSYESGYEATQSKQYKNVLLEGASIYTRGYRSKVQAIGGLVKTSNGPKFRTIMDNMLGLELPFFAAIHGGDPIQKDIAAQHARTVAKNHVRPNGSVYQNVLYDPKSGKPVHKYNLQGLSNDSTWSRGQAWALSGFTIAYRETKDPQFLDTARKTADYFIENLPSDNVPYWDFQAPGIPNAPKDSSAAAIAASYLFELSTIDPELSRQSGYFKAAENILLSLISPEYQASSGEAILKHGTQNMNQHLSNTGLVYGDYYFLKALSLYKKIFQN